MASLKELKGRIGSVKSTQSTIVKLKLIGLAALTVSANISPLSAQEVPVNPEPANSTVQVYTTMLGAVSVMNNQFPRLTDFRAQVAGKCGENISDSDDIKVVPIYCYCAGVVTTAIWMTYPDQKIRANFVEIMDKGKGDIDELVSYSSPSLYNSICKAVDSNLAERARNKSIEE